MTFTIQLPDYSPDTGVQHIWEPGFIIKTDLEHGELNIQANAAGLRSLANILLFLAQDGVPNGSHTHLDGSGELEPGSISLMIGRNDPPT